MVRDLLEQALVAAKELRNNAMRDTDELVAFVTANPKLAWELIHVLADTAEAVDPIKEVLDYDRDPVDLETADFAAGYCIAQIRDGLFNKPCKVLGGVPHTLSERDRRQGIVEPGDGDYMVWRTWQEANAVLEAMAPPEIQASFRVFPVLLAFGKEPKLLKPRDEDLDVITVPGPKMVAPEGDIRCPHCNEVFVLPDVAEGNCEAYGTTSFNLKHSCGHVIRVMVGREVHVYGIELAAPTATDDFDGSKSDPLQPKT